MSIFIYHLFALSLFSPFLISTVNVINMYFFGAMFSCFEISYHNFRVHDYYLLISSYCFFLLSTIFSLKFVYKSKNNFRTKQICLQMLKKSMKLVNEQTLQLFRWKKKAQILISEIGLSAAAGWLWKKIFSMPFVFYSLCFWFLLVQKRNLVKFISVKWVSNSLKGLTIWL